MPKTAADLTPEELEAYREARRRRWAEEGAWPARRQKQDWAVACAARLLKERFGARRVQAFGLLPTPWFRERSDIDLAVEDVPLERLGEAEAALTELAPDFRVDLVPLEELRDAPRLPRRIEEKGVDL
ncbi:MAG: nucleotidyltransferase domain-containing protein [Thermoflexus sp.]|jgi:predicted nucleotidyltransferase|nr:nucleotidyltransferase domain-containing protein [Thermoflexus sp.]